MRGSRVRTGPRAPARRRRPGATLAAAAALAAAALAGCEVLMPQRSPGERLYRRLCAECHGVDGSGNTPRYMGNPWADLRDASWRYGGDPASIENTIRQGVFGEMPAHPELSREEMRQLVDYLLELRGEGR